MTQQLSLFDQIKPLIDWFVHPNTTRTCHTQGYVYCANCGAWIGCTGMYSWNLTEDECKSESLTDWHMDDRCYKCGCYIGRKGGIFRSYNVINEEKDR